MNLYIFYNDNAVLSFLSFLSFLLLQLEMGTNILTYYNTFTTFIVLPERVEDDLAFGKVHDIAYKDGIIFHVQVYTSKE